MTGSRRTALLGAASLVVGLLVSLPAADAVHLPVGQRQEIASPGSVFEDSFGNAVAVDGDTLVVGEPTAVTPIDPPPGRDEAQLRAATQAYSRIIEERVRARPEQWVWIHRRWRTRPREYGPPPTSSGSTP